MEPENEVAFCFLDLLTDGMGKTVQEVLRLAFSRHTVWDVPKSTSAFRFGCPFHDIGCTDFGSSRRLSSRCIASFFAFLLSEGICCNRFLIETIGERGRNYCKTFFLSLLQSFGTRRLGGLWIGRALP